MSIISEYSWRKYLLNKNSCQKIKKTYIQEKILRYRDRENDKANAAKRLKLLNVSKERN